MRIFKILLLVVLNTLIYPLNGQIGIGTHSPDNSTVVDIVASDKGISLPQIQLISENDKTVIPNPKKGLLIYNNGTSLPEGIYYNSGDPSSPTWTKLDGINSSSGSLVAKIPFSLASPDSVIELDDIQIRYNASKEGGYSQIKSSSGTLYHYNTFIMENWVKSGSKDDGMYNAASNTTCTINGSFVNICEFTSIGSANEFNDVWFYIDETKTTYHYRVNLVKVSKKIYASQILEKF
ncbi:hypothetical protein UJ101_01250 [Flavobacteriaceae bacterium UJ101]|nr:hypothetical protein UJ101_01250 [Flavobacteriaceae bacterium UJ101]